MSFSEEAINIATALGNGIYSVGEDIVLGAERTGEGWGLGKDGRSAEIGYENSAMKNILIDFARTSISDERNPLYKCIYNILEEYYSKFPEEILQQLASKAGVGAGYMAGRMLIGQKLAKTIALKICTVIATTTAYKQMAKKLGVSAAASATGVGIPIGLLMLQGVMQRSSHAALRLRKKCPELFSKLHVAGNLQLLYFLVEKPMHEYISTIEFANTNQARLAKIISDTYSKKSNDNDK
ncbi:hypothetical protein QCD60_08950 [Pokkaliibacter sp. MBI-7]|uniref:hypothetical protein n=1 Tax=Pokkaliibacter sp. MBI-7 TaxID=3040600 RepID=UPI00244A7979|nr:hypothetical protein [Pokkaliibacter sp. MBI-7]MDH2432692.1 hypothetical protein [Pokkaliibacter sp. MBI-7]